MTERQPSLPDSEVYCYIGRQPSCGSVVAVTVDTADSKKRTARYIAEWIREGMAIERVSLETFRGLKMQRCTCKDRAKKEGQECLTR